MTMAPSQLGAFREVRSRAARRPICSITSSRSRSPKFGEPLDPFPAFTASVANIRPTSRGWVRITAPDPTAQPEIRPNYLATAEDRHVAARSVRVTRNIVSMPALAKYRPEEFRPGLEFQNDEELAKAAGDISTTIFHPVGTCKMGSDDDGAVVDPRLKVRGLAGLRVADASDHAHHHVRQHQLAHPDDRRESRRHDPGGRARTSVSRHRLGCHGRACLHSDWFRASRPHAPAPAEDCILGPSPRMTPNSLLRTN